MSISEQARGWPTPQVSFLASDYHFDLVRPGIAIFGHDPHYKTAGTRVKPVAPLQERLAQVKTAANGDYIGYGANVHCHKPTVIGVVMGVTPTAFLANYYYPINGEIQSVSISGHRAPLLGRVSMDLTIVDSSEPAKNSASPGDCAEFFGRDLRIEVFAEQAGTIPHEILTHIGSRVFRVYNG